MAFTMKPLAAGKVVASSSRKSVVVKASAQQEVPRRAALGLIAAGAAALTSVNAPAFAAYGESARIWGGVTNTTGYVPYAGDGFSVLIPSKWNPSKEQDFKGIVLRYEDNGDAVNNLTVIEQKTDKKAISDFGSPEAVLEQLSYLLGKQAFAGETQSEGGFAPNRVSAASLLDVSSTTDKKGKVYYKYDILTRTADGDEGGRRNLITATVGNGNLYILKVQAGDKRWIKNLKKEANAVTNSFTVA